MSYVRTPEHKALRAALIRSWRPWELSTGPKSSEGKKRAAMRGLKGRVRPLMRDLSRVLRDQAKQLKW